MKIFEPIYDWVLKLSKHPKAVRYLGALSFAESSFFPIPPDLMLMPMAFARRDKAWYYALVTTVTSVLGGILGYLIGYFLFDAYGAQILGYFDAQEAFESSKALYSQYGMLIVLLAGFTPVPYKIFTIASGVMAIAFLPFVLMSIIGRGGRFFLVAGLIKLGGDKLESTIQSKVEWVGWISLILVLLVIWLFH